MYFNPAIIVAVLVQMVVSRVSRIAGAVFGFLITTGILIWGLMVYAAGGQITFLTIPLSLPIFVVACLVWFGFDTRELVLATRARAARARVEEPAPQEGGWEQE
jgi:hypothetical protein